MHDERGLDDFVQIGLGLVAEKCVGIFEEVSCTKVTMYVICCMWVLYQE